MMNCRRIFLAGMVLVLLAGAGEAATIETVVVTARPPDPVGNDAFSVVMLASDDIRNVTELDTALEQVPGLSLFRRDSSLSANPTTQGVSLRSVAPSGAGRALVTLDGVPQNDPFGGWVIWSSLPVEDIAAAEIVRGAGAGPYGAGALTGVVALAESRGDGLVAEDARRRRAAKRLVRSRSLRARPLKTATAGFPFRLRSVARPTTM
jgi:iron complex outermembrane recepter protein